jgi:amino acid permease
MNYNSCNAIAMADGGPATLVYGYIFCWLGALVTAASLAEMASMYDDPYHKNICSITNRNLGLPLPPVNITG